MKKLTIILALLFSFFLNEGFAQYLDISFESPTWKDNIKLDTTQKNIWEVAVPNKTFFNDDFDVGGSAILTDANNPYSSNTTSSFILTLNQYFSGPDYLNTKPPWYSGCQCDFTTFGFLQKLETDTMLDGGMIEISYDAGNNWINAAIDTFWMNPVNGNGRGSDIYYRKDTVQSLGQAGISGNYDWQNESRVGFGWVWVDDKTLEAPDSILLKFTFASDSIDTAKEGWMIDKFFISIGWLVGIEGVTIEQQYNFYPNPVFNKLLIKTKEKKLFNYQLFDINGKLLNQSNKFVNNTVEIPFGDYPKGVYLVKITTDKESFTKKIIKR